MLIGFLEVMVIPVFVSWISWNLRWTHGLGTYWRIMDSLVVDKGQELQQKMLNHEVIKKYLGPCRVEGKQTKRSTAGT